MPVISKASNALYAKCRAMFGKRLTKHDIQNLLSCRTLSEIAAYLKANTIYAPALANIDERLTHRGQLEAELNRLLFERYEALCRYELSVGEPLGDYIMLRTEARQLLIFLQYLRAGNPQDYLFRIPAFFEEHTDVELMGLSQVTDFNGFLEHIKKSRFYPAMKKIAPVNGMQLDYTLAENVTYAELYSIALDIVKKHYVGQPKDELLDLFGTEIELHNVLSVYRLKKYYKASPDLIRSLVYPYYARIRKKLMDEMIEAESAEKVLELLLTKTPYRRETSIDRINDLHIDAAFSELKYKRARHYMRFSTNPSVVLMSFMNISETELTEIVTIIEGVRYGLPPEEIESLIIMDDYN